MAACGNQLFRFAGKESRLIQSGVLISRSYETPMISKGLALYLIPTHTRFICEAHTLGQETTKPTSLLNLRGNNPCGALVIKNLFRNDHSCMSHASTLDAVSTRTFTPSITKNLCSVQPIFMTAKGMEIIKTLKHCTLYQQFKPIVSKHIFPCINIQK